MILRSLSILLPSLLLAASLGAPVAFAAGGCVLPGPRLQISLPEGSPPWTLVEMRSIAELALAGDEQNALWRWENLMAGPDFRELSAAEVGLLTGAVRELARVGLELRFGEIPTRLAHFSSVHHQLNDARREADLALVRLERSRSNVSGPYHLKMVRGFPTKALAGVTPVLVRQEGWLDRHQLEDYLARLERFSEEADRHLERARLDHRDREARLEEVLGVLARLESAMRWSVTKAAVEGP